MTKPTDTPTPMMAQWHACKKQAAGALLLFQMGDFYEAFYDDAVKLAEVLDLTLTKRQEIPMAGVPLHTCDSYIDRLVSKGHRVAIAEQTEDPSKTKGLVNREVVRIVTPGSVIDSSLIEEKANNFFASLCQVGTLFGLAFVDLSTGECAISEFESEGELLNELYRLRPAEILTSKKFRKKNDACLAELKSSYPFLITTEEEWKFEHQFSYGQLTNHFGVNTLDGYGLKGKVAAINAAGALLSYLKETLLQPCGHILDISPYSPSHFMTLDVITQKNLELTEALHQGKTLLSILDHTVTPMGGRKLRNWIKQPLLSLAEIKKRQDTIALLVRERSLTLKLKETLKSVRDIERLIAKISSQSGSPKDLKAIGASFEAIPKVKALLEPLLGDPLILELARSLHSLPDMTGLIERALVDEPPLRVSDGSVIREGFHQELDELKALCQDNKTWIANYQTELREQLGIKTLKVGFNRMFGYYIEVSKGQTDKMPDHFVRRQTLVNSERYISPELKSYETKVLTAEDKIGAIESELFSQIKKEVATYAPKASEVSKAVAVLDCLRSLAEAALENGYCRPQMDTSYDFSIEEGRHPVIELSLGGTSFVPNDTFMNRETDRLFLITGPNMSGKSTYIRQVALIAIMAQMGSFIPARAGKLGIVDKVFTRIGASDDLSRGQSTFMVEMAETANILNNATDRSLVILDEIGRGTSTYDGISIAWAVAEYLLTAEGKQAKTLFATHYWELTKLEDRGLGAKNYHVAVQECDNQVLFLHKIIQGGTDKSYGIHVAKLAGMPHWVLERSAEILDHLEQNANRKSAFEPGQAKKHPPRRKKRSGSEDQLLLGLSVEGLN